MTELFSPTQIKQMELCELYSQGSRSIAACCKAVGVTLGQHYHWLKTDKWYQEGWRMAEGMYKSAMKELLDDRVRNGVESIKTVYTLIKDPNTGEVTKIPVEETVTRKHSDHLLTLYLKALIPETFGKQEKKVDERNIAEILASARRRIGESPEQSDE